MIKLSELQNDAKVMDKSENVYDVEDVKNDLQYFKDTNKKFYTTTEYHACLNAKEVLEDAIENEYENNMYEDWDENILSDITDEDIKKIQVVLDEIFSRSKSQNIAYYQGEEIEIDLEVK